MRAFPPTAERHGRTRTSPRRSSTTSSPTNHFPYQVCGAQQDNSTLCGPSRKAGGIDVRDWVEAGGGESGYIASRSDDPDVVYAGSYGALLTRKDLRTGLTRNINPWPDNPMGHSAIDLKYRFQWTYPIVLSPHNPNVLYATSNYVHRTTNDGQSWEVISPDLTRNDPKTLGPSGGPLTKDQTSVEYYGVIFAFAESPKQKGVLWAGSDDGLDPRLARQRQDVEGRHAEGHGDLHARVDHRAVALQRRNGVRRREPLPARRHEAVSLEDDRLRRHVEAHRRRHRRRPSLRAPSARTTRSRDSSTSARSAASGSRTTTAATWQRLQLNLPPVPVHDLAIKEGDLIAATHGRSFWVIDDISRAAPDDPDADGGGCAPVQAARCVSRDVRRTWLRWWWWRWRTWRAAGPPVHPIAASPAGGPVVSYWLKQPNREVVLEFMDAKGKLIRSFTSKQDSATAADSVTRFARSRARVDSLVRSGHLVR